jgi:hypothetical protein
VGSCIIIDETLTEADKRASTVFGGCPKIPLMPTKQVHRYVQLPRFETFAMHFTIFPTTLFLKNLNQ